MKAFFKILLVVALLAFSIAVARQMFCWPRWDMEVFVNDERHAASATTCPNGRILVDIPGEAYILIDPDFQAASYPNDYFYKFLGLTLSKDPDPVGISIADRVKIDNNPGVEFSENSILYSDLVSHDRILIKRVR